MELDSYIARTPHLTEENFMPASWIFLSKDGRTFGVPWGSRWPVYSTTRITWRNPGWMSVPKP